MKNKSLLLICLFGIMALATGCEDICVSKEKKAIDREFYLFEIDNQSIKLMDYVYKKNVELYLPRVRGYFNSECVAWYHVFHAKKLINDFNYFNLSEKVMELKEDEIIRIGNARHMFSASDFKKFFYILFTKENYTGIFSDISFTFPSQVSTVHVKSYLNFSLTTVQKTPFHVTRIAPDTLLYSQVPTGFFDDRNQPIAIVSEQYYKLSTDILGWNVLFSALGYRLRFEEIGASGTTTLLSKNFDRFFSSGVFDNYIWIVSSNEHSIYTKKLDLVRTLELGDYNYGYISGDGAHLYDYVRERIYSVMSDSFQPFPSELKLKSHESISMNYGKASALLDDNNIVMFDLSEPNVIVKIEQNRIKAFIDSAYTKYEYAELNFSSIWTGKNGKTYVPVVRSLYSSTDLEPCN